MTDVEAKTPTKRKNVSNVQKISAKKAKIDKPQKGAFTKQNNAQSGSKKFNKKNKNNELGNVSPKKLQPFPGTKATSEKTKNKKDNEVVKADETKVREKKGKRKALYHTLAAQVRSDDKKDALAIIETKIKDFQSRTDISRSGKKKLAKLLVLKKVALGIPLGKPQKENPPETKLEKKQNVKKPVVANKELKKNVQQSAEAKANGKANKNVKVQNKKSAKTVVPQKQVESDDSEEDVESEDESGDEELEGENESDEVGAEEESDDEGNDESEEVNAEDSDEEGDEEEESGEEESDEDDSEDNSPPPPKVSNKKQKKK